MWLNALFFVTQALILTSQFTNKPSVLLTVAVGVTTTVKFYEGVQICYKEGMSLECIKGTIPPVITAIGWGSKYFKDDVVDGDDMPDTKTPTEKEANADTCTSPRPRPIG
ncbi:uncharacterized protein [Amphiura filiformis]|uniref:uncharacterized protein n=1 Tax=Amphiura filiformis TaxID=82378 RepID=UPI003B212C10